LENDDRINISACDRSTKNNEDSPQLLDLQTKVDCNRYEEEGDEMKSPDQQFILYVSPTEIGQSIVNYEISERNQQLQYSHLEQQHRKVFLYGFNDLIANYLESMRNIYVKIFLPDESWIYHLFKPLSCSIYIHLFLGSRSRILSAN
jgi:hypothetical protein